jgi:hypothetical protein
MGYLRRTLTAALASLLLLAGATHAQMPATLDASRQPNPASEAAVRRMTEEALRWQINYDLLTDSMAAQVRAQEAGLRQMFAQLGSLQSISFVGVDPQGRDVFDVRHANGTLRWTIQLTPAGKTATAVLFRTVDARGAPVATSTRVILPAVDGIFQAFKTHSLVGLGDDHGLALGMDFYATMVRDPRFAQDVGNVVVEFGAGGRQDVIDRYVAGGTVPYTQLRTIWTDTVGWIPNAGWLGFAKLLATVREVNKGLPSGKRIRVWAGEPPMDWSKGNSADFLRAIGSRDSYAAQVLEKNILSAGKKALVLYGGYHFAGNRMLRGKIEVLHPDAFFVVLPYTESLKTAACAPLLDQVAKVWPTAALATSVGDGPPDPIVRDCANMDGRSTATSFVLTRNGSAPQPRIAATVQPFDSVVGSGNPLVVDGDAVVFYAPLQGLTKGPWIPDYFLDADYRVEMNRRALLAGRTLMRFPVDASLRKSDYEIDLDAPGYTKLINTMFKKYDRNGDGTITAEEYWDPIPQ